MAPLKIKCHVGSLGAVAGLPPWPLAVAEKRLNEYFEAAAITTAGPQLALTFDYTQVSDNPAPGLKEVVALDLHEHLESLLHNPLKASSVAQIGLIFAPRYAPAKGSSFFGLMFDAGTSATDDSNTFYQGVPREGCAVFLDSIADARQTDVERLTEVLFTTLHELGHVFNLWHVDQPRCLMTRSATLPWPLDPTTEFVFAPEHRAFLGNVAVSPYVWPGGSPFTERGTLVPAGIDNAGNRSTSRGDLRLELEIAGSPFFRWEPVELDVRLRLRSRARRAAVVPDAVDPCYEHFRIWIEQPSGARRLYRTRRRYCTPTHQLVIQPGGGFERDVSIFLGAGGHTFRDAGPHRVWAEFASDAGRFLTSNIVEVEVRSELRLDADETRARRYLAHPSVVPYLYHRAGSLRRKGLRLLEEYTYFASRSRRKAACLYTLGRVYERAAATTRRHATRRDLLIHSRRLLASALRSNTLSPHRARIAESRL